MPKATPKKKTTGKPRKKLTPCKDWRPPNQRLTKRQMRDFLVHLVESGNVSLACRQAGAKRGAIYKRARDDEEFSAAFEEAKTLGWCGLEDDTLDLARNGFDEPVFHDGDVCGIKRRFYPALNIFLLKAHDPARYRERIDIDHGGKSGAPLTMQVIMDPRAVAEAGK